MSLLPSVVKSIYKLLSHYGRHGCTATCYLSILIPLFFSLPLLANDNPIEHKIKAGYLYNFTKFIDWPDEGEVQLKTLTICLLGKDHFGNVLDRVQTKKSKGRRIRLFRLKQLSPDVKQCQILFIADSEAAQLASILGSVADFKLLTVGNSKQFALTGGMISFILDSGKVRLQINRTAIENAGLTISAKLLEVAQIVGPAQ